MNRAFTILAACVVAGLLLAAAVPVYAFLVQDLMSLKPTIASRRTAYASEGGGGDGYWRSDRVSRWFGATIRSNSLDANGMKVEVGNASDAALEALLKDADSAGISAAITRAEAPQGIVEHVSGWPWRCMGVAMGVAGAAEAQAVSKRLSARMIWLQPMSPIMDALGVRNSNSGTFGWIDWVSFAGNAGAVALMLAGMVYAPQSALMVRARHRRRNGRCEQCGYKLDGIVQGVPCPECGERPRGPASATLPTTVRP